MLYGAHQSDLVKCPRDSITFRTRSWYRESAYSLTFSEISVILPREPPKQGSLDQWKRAEEAKWPA